MKRIFLTAVLLLAAISVSPATGASAETEFCVGASPDGTLSLRKTPTANGGNVIYTLYNSDCGIFIAPNPARSGGYVRVRIGGARGWVKSKWLARATPTPQAASGTPNLPLPRPDRDWRSFASSGLQTYFLDTTSQTVDGVARSAWVKAEGPGTLLQGRAYSSSIAQWAVNCSKWSISTGASVYYDDAGSVVQSFGSGWSSPSTIIPDSIAEAFATQVCV
jgi:hypothetical protein